MYTWNIYLHLGHLDGNWSTVHALDAELLDDPLVLDKMGFVHGSVHDLSREFSAVSMFQRESTEVQSRDSTTGRDIIINP